MNCRIIFTLISFTIFLGLPTRAKAKHINNRDSLLKILQINKPSLRERELILYLPYYFADVPLNQLSAVRTDVNHLLEQYQIEASVALSDFIKTLNLIQQQKYRDAERVLVRAIAQADKNDDHYLLFAFYTHLGFIQTYYGNITDAIFSFRIAKKEASILNDPYMQVIIDINISDIYYKINLYSQSLFYLNQAQSLVSNYHISVPKIKNAITNNIAECYFGIGDIDSLKKYNQVLNMARTGSAMLYTYQQRTDYYLDLLKHNYPAALSRLRGLMKDNRFELEATDEQNLAEAYFRAGQLDSAKVVANRLLAEKEQNNHSEINMHLYEILGKVAEHNKDDKASFANYKQALQQAKEQINRLTRVDTISSRIKLDEMQTTYIQKAESYKSERLWMGFATILTVLALIMGALSYRNIKRKKYYEEMLFKTKKAELAFINSHEVRRHLSNILGIVDMVKQSEDKYHAYLETEEHLLSAVRDLDSSIRNISSKLDE